MDFNTNQASGGSSDCTDINTTQLTRAHSLIDDLLLEKGTGIGCLRCREREAEIEVERYRTAEKEKSNIVDWGGPDDPQKPQNFPRRRKWLITLLSGSYVFGVSFASSVFSSVTEVTAEEFGVSPEVMILGVSLYILSFAAVLLKVKAKRLRRETKNRAPHAKTEEPLIRAKDLAVKYFSRPVGMLAKEPILNRFEMIILTKKIRKPEPHSVNFVMAALDLVAARVAALPRETKMFSAPAAASTAAYNTQIAAVQPPYNPTNLQPGSIFRASGPAGNLPPGIDVTQPLTMLQTQYLVAIFQRMRHIFFPVEVWTREIRSVRKKILMVVSPLAKTIDYLDPDEKRLKPKNEDVMGHILRLITMHLGGQFEPKDWLQRKNGPVKHLFDRRRMLQSLYLTKFTHSAFQIPLDRFLDENIRIKSIFARIRSQRPQMLHSPHQRHIYLIASAFYCPLIQREPVGCQIPCVKLTGNDVLVFMPLFSSCNDVSTTSIPRDSIPGSQSNPFPSGTINNMTMDLTAIVNHRGLHQNGTELTAPSLGNVIPPADDTPNSDGLLVQQKFLTNDVACKMVNDFQEAILAFPMPTADFPDGEAGENTTLISKFIYGTTNNNLDTLLPDPLGEG
ncbi:hypothetical protein G7Y89_g7915 [Cudoniella acicularis]|uniref:Uncharacterized protein n=1 Tax=Cudoniella acicularis TaxID=354080 RepID=A0A8H4RJV5_9HELO|nr:hypothetical protein G7Y89_g7915 [Cudoniella acicularis]